jgi:hypothetical protein
MVKNWIIRQSLIFKDTKSNSFYRLVFTFQSLLFDFYFIDFDRKLKH